MWAAGYEERACKACRLMFFTRQTDLFCRSYRRRNIGTTVHEFMHELMREREQ
jgi:hypothetical protein